MKTYKITVNGVSYDVTVEGDRRCGLRPRRSCGTPVPVAAPPRCGPCPAAAPAPAPAAQARCGACRRRHGGSSPMPGTILKVNVAVGAEVKKGDVLLILEAMKMENEIMAPCDGKVLSVSAKSGDSVNAGDALVSIG